MCVGVEKGCIARVRLSVHRASRDQYFQMSPLPTYPSGQIGFMLCSKNPVSRSGLAPGWAREPGRWARRACL